MTTAIKRRRGTAAEHESFAGLEGELTVNTTNDSVHVHDGVTAGGHELARADGSNLEMTTDLNFGDNDKAVFGAGSDLQIYHDGTNSYVTDAGTGLLTLQGSEVRIKTTAGENMAVFNPNGSVQIQYDNSTKFTTTSTGVDVTGTVTADGLTVDGSSSSQLRFYDGGGNSARAVATIDFDTNVTNPYKIMETSVGSYSNYWNTRFYTGDGSEKERMLIETNGDISFYEQTGTTPKFFWDASAESLSIGSTLPYAGQTLTVGATAPKIQLDNGAGTILTSLSHDGSTGNTATLMNQRLGAFRFGTNNSEAMRIDSSGNVGIGTSSPIYPLDVAAPSNIYARFASSAVSAEFGITSPTPNVINLGAGSGDALSFSSNFTEAMRIDSSGNLLVGTTDAALGYTNGDTGLVSNPAGFLQIARDSSQGYPLLYLNRLNHDGKHIEFWKDGVSVGSIGVDAGSNATSIYIGGNDTGLDFGARRNDVIAPMSPATGTYRDDAISLGGGTERFKDLFLSGGVYLGGIGSANYLDDYETGTWTPTAEGSTTAGTGTYSSLRNGYYEKVGSLVHVQGVIGWTAHTGTGALRIAGLPFTLSSSTNNFTSASFGDYSGLSMTVGEYLTGSANSNTTHINLYNISTDSGSSVVSTQAVDTAVSYIIFSMSYRTDS